MRDEIFATLAPDSYQVHSQVGVCVEVVASTDPTAVESTWYKREVSSSSTFNCHSLSLPVDLGALCLATTGRLSTWYSRPLL